MSEALDERVSALKSLVEEIRLYNDPQELENLKKLIRKNVPLTMRGYLMAYLFKTSKYFVTPAKTASYRRNAKPKTERIEKPDFENSKSLYINVGKQSRSSARDLAQFICNTANIEDRDIISIAFKQNYSFVYVSKEKADEIIEAVNGKQFKGRKVKINHSKEKNED